MLSASSPEIRELLEAFKANQDVAHTRTGGWYMKPIAEDRKKYIAIDEVDRDATAPFHYPHISHRGGRFLIDRNDGVVYTIKGYGQRGYRVGTVESLTRRYREATATFDPSLHMHAMGRDMVAVAPQRKSGLTVLQGGRPRRRVGRSRSKTPPKFHKGDRVIANLSIGPHQGTVGGRAFEGMTGLWVYPVYWDDPKAVGRGHGSSEWSAANSVAEPELRLIGRERRRVVSPYHTHRSHPYSHPAVRRHRRR